MKTAVNTCDFRFTLTLLGLWVSPVEIGISVVAIAITCGIHDAIGLCFGVLRAKQAAKFISHCGFETYIIRTNPMQIKIYTICRV